MNWRGLFSFSMAPTPPAGLLLVIAAVLPALVTVIPYQWLRLQRLRRRASVSDVAAWVGTLLRSYAPGSVLIAKPNGKDGFLQFALTQRDREWRTLEFGLPDTAWSREAMAGIQNVLNFAEIDWTVEPALFIPNGIHES